MKLNDFDKKNVAARALHESFAMNFDVSNLDRAKTRVMLNKVNSLINESRRSPKFHTALNDPTYLKLKFMEQVLSQHLRTAKTPRIVFENEEVNRSQVILAAQDMVDSIQKYYEDVNDMLVKELPAIIDSIQSEIGVTESDAYNQQAYGALTTLNAALQAAKTAMTDALNGLTGQGNMNEFGSEPGMGDEEVDIDFDLDDEAPAEEELPPMPDLGSPEEPNDSMGNVGRMKR
jgi:hypothetical protein